MEEKMESENLESFADLLAQHEAGGKKLQVGQKISGRIIAISGDSVFVDIGIKEDGVMDSKEIMNADGKATAAPGDEVQGWIIGISSQGVRISKSMAGSGVAALEEARDAGVPVDGRVKEACKGGYHVDVLGKTAFCPGSQMENPPSGNPEDNIGRQMQFLITRIENHGRNIVVSRRALIERERKESLDKLLGNLNIGDTVEGRVSRIAPFGVFMELAPSVEGMIHLSELSWSRVESADEVVSLDDKIRARVIAIGKDDKGHTRIALSCKQAEGDPWNAVTDRFAIGDIVDGKVRRLAQFGAFVEVAPGIEGLVHVSEMSWTKRINKPEDVLTAGDSVRVKIKDINPETRRMSLSLRDAEGDPWATAAETFIPGTKVSGIVESRTPHGLFVTLAPGITGLLPASALRNSPLAKAGSGDSVTLVIQKIDVPEKRISLMPESSESVSEDEDKSWREHLGNKTSGTGNLGIMAQALQKAFQKK